MTPAVESSTESKSSGQAAMFVRKVAAIAMAMIVSKINPNCRKICQFPEEQMRRNKYWTGGGSGGGIFWYSYLNLAEGGGGSST